jgi:uncharacterized protein YjbI with pentapeptide repeats
MSASEFDDLLQKQRDCTGTQKRHDFEITGVDLTDVPLAQRALAGCVFDGCRLVDLDLSRKTLLFRVAFGDCRFENVRVRADRILKGQGDYVLAPDGAVVEDRVG